MGYAVASTRLPSDHDERDLLGIVVRDEAKNIFFASGPQANQMVGKAWLFTRRLDASTFETSCAGNGFSFAIDYPVPSDMIVAQSVGRLRYGEPVLTANTNDGKRRISVSLEFFKTPVNPSSDEN